jgi:dTDP-glucose 4,6-dehydratase
MDFEPGLKATVDWYRAHDKWVRDVKSGEYQTYYARNYGNRTSELNQVRA